MWKLGYCWLKKKKRDARRHEERRKCRRVKVRVGALNVGSMTGTERELAYMMEGRKVDIL